MAEAYRQDGLLNIPTQAAADEMFKQKFGMSPQEWATREGTIDNVPETTAADAARYLGQSFGFGFGDEIEALFRTGQISGEEFKAARSAARESAQHFENQRPNTALAMDLAGFVPVIAGMAMSVPVSGPVVGAAALGRAAIKGGQKILHNIGPIKFGALAGLTHGAGSTEPIEGTFFHRAGNRLFGGSDDAAVGAGFGVVLSRAAPPVIRFLSKMRNKLSFKSGSMYK